MMSKILFNVIKYALEGSAIAIAASIVSKGKLSVLKTVTLAVTASLIFLILDMYAPIIGNGTRHGTGFGLGFSMINGPLTGGDPDMCGGDQSGGSCGISGGSTDQSGGSCGMCGGGSQDEKDSSLLGALQHQVAGAFKTNELASGQYGVSLIPSFNEYAKAYNHDELNNLSQI